MCGQKSVTETVMLGWTSKSQRIQLDWVGGASASEITVFLESNIIKIQLLFFFYILKAFRPISI